MLLDKILVFVVMRLTYYMNFYLDFQETFPIWSQLGLGSPHSDPTVCLCPGASSRAWAGGGYPWSRTPRPGPGPKQVFREGLLIEWDESKGRGLSIAPHFYKTIIFKQG